MTHAVRDADLQRPHLFRNLFKDTLWYVCASILSSAMMLVMTMVLARLLGREQFGAFGLVQTAVMLCTTILVFGGDVSVMIYAGKFRQQRRDKNTGSCLLYLAITTVATSLLVYLDTPGPGSITMSRLSADVAILVVLFTTAQTFFLLWDSMLRGSDRFRASSIVVAAGQSSLATGAILGTFGFGTYTGALWGTVAMMFLVAAAILVVEARRTGVSFPSLRSFLRLIGSVGARSYTVKVSEIAAEGFGILYLSTQGDLAGIAALVGCRRIASVLSKPATIMSAVLAGKVAGQVSDQREAQKNLQVARLTFILGLFIAVPLLFFTQWIVVLLLGDTFRDATLVLVYFIISEALRAHASAAAGLLIGQGCRWPYVVLKVCVLVLTVIGVLTLGKAMGATGVALVQSILSLVMALFIAVILAFQARSFKAVFFGNDWQVLRRLAFWER